MRVLSLFSVSTVLSVASAQLAAYAQCGGISWTGQTTCVSGYYCYYQNAYYSQCIPGTGTTTSKTTTAGSGTTTAKQSTSSTTSSSTVATSAISSYARASGSVFTINGKEQYFMGTNTYWIGFLTNNADVDLVMSHLVASGLKVLRVWGFNDVSSTPGTGTVWFQSFVSGSSPVINTGEYGLQRLDYVVQSAEAHGISLIINFVNNWSDYGGIPLQSTYYGISITEWFNTAAVQTNYQKYIAAVVSRYKTSTAIFAWELCNEPRCTGCATSVITEWVTTTSAYIKSLDSNHMVTIGDEGFGLNGGSDTSYPYTTGPGLNFTANLAVPDIDFGTYHLYPSSWGETDSWGPGWIAAHATAAASIGKPVIMEEYGSDTHADEASWATEVLNTKTAGLMFWQYGDTLSTGQTANDGYTMYYGTSEFTTLVTNVAAAEDAKAA